MLNAWPECILVSQSVKMKRNWFPEGVAVMVKIVNFEGLSGSVKMDQLKLCRRLDGVHCCMDEELFHVERLQIFT